MKYYTNLFSQMLHVIKRNDFEKLVREHKAEAHSKGFSSWEHFAAMLFAQLGRAQSLREISYGLRTCLGKLNHLGMKKAPPRSTLSYANNHRPWELFRSVFYQTLNQCQMIAPGHKFRFKNTHITEGKIHEINIARNLSLPAGSIVVYDRGYVDYSFFQKCTDNDVYFVTRQKKNAKYDVVQEHKIPQRRNILSDQTIKVSGYYSVKKCASLLRRIVVWDAAKKKEIVLWTNHFKFGASTIAAIYKERWQIEIFFKTIKQNLRIKTFIGTTAIALKTQIWTALIAILLIKYMKLRSQVNWSLSNLIAMLRFNLFTYRDLWKWLQNPYDIKPIGPLIEQLEIVF